MSNSILFVGDSGATKTTQLFFLAKYYHSLNPTKKIRLIIAGGGEIEPFETSGMIDEGIVDAIDISFSTTFLATSRRIGEGYWPLEGDRNECQIKDDDKYKTDFGKENIGMYLLDGLSGLSSNFLSHLSNQENGAGFKESWRYEEDGISIIGLQMGHYGIVQKEVHKFITRGIKRLPVDLIGVSALIDKGEDKKRNTIYGPKIAGSALTEEIPSWFGDNFYLDNEIVEKEVKGEKIQVKKKVAWFKDHLDGDSGIKCLAKIRLLSELVPEFNQSFPRGFCELSYKKGIISLLEERDRIIREFKEREKKI